MEIQKAIAKIMEPQELDQEEMRSVMQVIMTGEATPAQIGGFLVGLRMKGETVNEITAAAGVMRDLSTKVHVNCANLVDTCGTGGDGAKTFNISTACAFVAAAAGANVAKHGNRSVSSSSGSADVLEAAGVNLNLSAAQVGQCIDEVGVGFMFAPNHHGAMKHAIGPRRDLGVRTIFNVLGPLTNPAGAPNQVLGVFSETLVEPLAHVLANMGSKHVLVVHADDGLDEISIGSTTSVAELNNGKVTAYRISPQELGFDIASLSSLRVDSVAQSLKMMQGVLDGIAGPAADIVLLNAGAAIYAAGKAESLATGIENARQAIKSGKAREKLNEFVAISNKLAAVSG